MQLVDETWPTVLRAGLVLVPVGSCEQHGPHLPLDTDTVIAAAVARSAATVLNATVAPAIAYGASGEHQGFPGTASIGSDALVHTVVELGRSLTTWASRVVFINGHGGNVSALRRGVHQLQGESRDIRWLPCSAPDADAHAGLTETSLMLHLDPHRVRMEDAEVGNTQSLADLIPTLTSRGTAAVSANGVLGDPTGATSAHGRTVLEQMTRTIVQSLEREHTR